MNPSALIARLIRESPSPASETAAALLLPLSRKLTTIIGQNGFQTLYDRSLHTAAKHYPWLIAAADASARLSDPEKLKAALCKQPVDQASHATVLLFSTLLELLVCLIGQSLTTNLLRDAWGITFEPADQDMQEPKK